MCLAFGVERLDDVAAKLEDVLELQPPQGLVEKVRKPREAEVDRRLAARRPCSNGAVPGGRARRATTSTSTLLPISAAGRATRRRSSRCPAVITQDPRDRRAQRRDVPDAEGRPRARRSCTGRSTRTAARTPRGARRPDPGRGRARARPGHRLRGERAAAEARRRADGRGLPQGRPRSSSSSARPSTSRCRRTRRSCSRAGSTRATPAWRGPFGDHTGYYTPPEEFPLFRISAITMRRDAIYPSIVVGKPPAEDEWLAKATERIFLPAIRMSVPEIVDYDLPTAGAFHNCVIVSIRKRFPGHARKVMHAIWGLGLLSLSKAVVVVDARRRRPRLRGGLLPRLRERRPEARRRAHRGPARPARPRSVLQFFGGKIGFDATREGARGGRARVAAGDRDEPTRSARVDARWAESGCRRTPTVARCRMGAGLRRPVACEAGSVVDTGQGAGG